MAGASHIPSALRASCHHTVMCSGPPRMRVVSLLFALTARTNAALECVLRGLMTDNSRAVLRNTSMEHGA